MKNIPSDIWEEQLHRMRRIMEQELTPLQRYTLQAYYFEKKNLKTIARERGVNRSTVWRTFYRAREKLSRILNY